MNALQLAQEHVAFHHGNADGWVTLAQKNEKGFKQFHYTAQELADHLKEWTGDDVYFSQNTFYKPQRRIDSIRQLRSLYVDLDVYNVGMDPEYALGKLEFDFFGQTIPEPNLVIFSGRGLVLVWNIDPVPYQAMPLWKALEGHFIKELAEVGADPKASDPARIFRLAGTINSKSGTMVRTQYRHDYRYDIHDLQFDYLPEIKPKEKKPGRQPKVVHLFNVYTLHLSRARDIATLVELRNGEVDSYRELICFLYRYFTCCYTSDPDTALEQTKSLNAEFTHPLREREVVNATKSAQKAWAASSDKEANEVAKSLGYPGAGYRLKNSTIIDWLDITADEQRAMSTIIGSTEKRRRNAASKMQARRAAGVKPRDEYIKQEKEKTADKVSALRHLMIQNPNWTNQQLAGELGISRSTLKRLKRAASQ